MSAHGPPLRINGYWSSPHSSMGREIKLLAHDDFADLYDRCLVGVVRDVRHNLLCVGSKTSLKRFHRIAEDVAHSNICCRSAGCSTCEALINGIILAASTHPGFHEGHMPISI